MEKSDLYKVKHDMYGNPRVVVHFCRFRQTAKERLGVGRKE